MSIKKLNELAGKYTLSDEIIEQRENERLSFVEKFPLTQLKDLSIDQFVQGTDDNSFCYWLEFKKIGFGIGGGNASKFGIYKTKNKEEIVYATGYGKNKNYLDDQGAKDYFSDLLNKILKALDYTRSDEIDKIKELEIPMWNMVLQKILGIYYPDKFLTIGSPTVLIKCAKQLGIQNIEHTSDNSILINYECKKAISKNPLFSNWSYEKIGNFIWETFDGENKKRKRKDSERYWLYAPGENAYMWDEFYQDGIIGLGWDDIGDLAQYKSRDEIKKALVDAYGGTGSKKNDVSANDDFLNKIKIGDVIIAKKGRGELLGYGVVTSDYIFDKNRMSYQKTRQIDWKIKGNWNVDFSLVLKTLTDITKYSSEDAEYDTFYEKLLSIMGVGKTQKDNRETFTSWLTKKYGENSGTTSSYIKAIDILSQILSKKLFRTNDDSYLDSLYKDLIKEQGNPEGKYYHSDAPSYGSNGFYSASIKSYREFLKTNQATQTLNDHQMEFSLNTILYGPPGTGKTFNTINTSLEICGDNIDNLNRKEIKALYQQRVEEGRIFFTTFHQSMTYEDFVEGIKPKMSGDDETEVSYEIEEGIFKSICKKAEKESSINSNFDNFDEEWEKLIDLVKTKLLENKLVKIGSWEYELSSKDSLKYSSLNTPSKYNFTITKQNVYDAYRNKKARPSGAFQKDMLDVVDFMKSQFNLNNYQENSIINKATGQNFVLIIDEINRGNVSQIFGELITLIEDDKRLGNPEAIQVKLPYSKDWFGVPPNVHIIGTMNTADRSVEALDTALRRRFSFTEMPPKSELIKTEGKTENGIINGIDLSALLETINKRIEKLLDKDHMIGHSYFLSVKALKDLKSAFQNKIVPLMQEYFFGDYGKIGLVIGSKFFDIKDNQVDEDFFAPFEDYDSSSLVERKVYHLKNIQDMSDELFVEALNNLQRKSN